MWPGNIKCKFTCFFLLQSMSIFEFLYYLFFLMLNWKIWLLLIWPDSDICDPTETSVHVSYGNNKGHIGKRLWLLLIFLTCLVYIGGVGVCICVSVCLLLPLSLQLTPWDLLRGTSECISRAYFLIGCFTKRTLSSKDILKPRSKHIPETRVSPVVIFLSLL